MGGVADLLAAQEKTMKICRLAGKRKCAKEKREYQVLQDELIELQRAVEEEHHTEEEEEERLCEAIFRSKMAANIEAVGWACKAKVKWARTGDVPRQFFFSTLKKKRKASILPKFPDVVQEDGQSPHDALKEHVKFYFRSLYAAQDTARSWEQDWAARYGKFPRQVTDEQNRLLEAPLTENEVYRALCNMPKGKSISKDGFPVEFYV